MMNMMKWMILVLFFSSAFSFMPRIHVPKRITRIASSTSDNNASVEPEKCVDCGETKNDCDNNKKKLNEKYDTLINRCCGEVNETDELEELEREFFDIYQKMKKHNKKRVIATTQQLYRLFRNGKE